MTVAQMRPLIDRALSSGGIFTFTPNGTSMLPLLRPGEDSVELTAPDGAGTGDIVLYKRENGAYVLHRIVSERDGSFVMCGDNQYKLEYGIKPEQIVALVSAINRDGEHIERGSDRLKKYERRLPFMRKSKKIRTETRRLLSKIKHLLIP